MESLGDLETALQFYCDGGDHTSIVRIHCYMGNIDKVGVAIVGVAALIAAHQAVNEVERSGDKAAAFHLAQRLETDVSAAINRLNTA